MLFFPAGKARGMDWPGFSRGISYLNAADRQKSRGILTKFDSFSRLCLPISLQSVGNTPEAFCRPMAARPGIFAAPAEKNIDMFNPFRLTHCSTRFPRTKAHRTPAAPTPGSGDLRCPEATKQKPREPRREPMTPSGPGPGWTCRPLLKTSQTTLRGKLWRDGHGIAGAVENLRGVRMPFLPRRGRWKNLLSRL
jgi:hypothetical protein